MSKRKMKRAYSYIRFSSLKQSKGDSRRRQLEWGLQVCKAKEWVLDDSLKMSDEGVSAFRGKNADTGALANFLEEIRLGKVLPGDVLLVESLDRLTREAIGDALELFRSILKTGVEIQTREPERHYTRASLDDFTSLLEVLVYMERAHNESKTKSMRGKGWWKGLRDRMAKEKRPIHQRMPAWLRLLPDRSAFEVIPEAAVAIQLIYKWAGEGLGTNPITARLNRQGVPPIARKKSWCRSYVGLLLRDRAVLGQYQPHEMQEGKRVPIGDPVPDYFPRVIGDTEWYAVRQAVKTRGKTGGRNGPGITNLFTGLLRDARDGETMHLTYAGSSRKANTRILLSNGCRNGEKGSVRMPFAYDAVEEAFLNFVRELKASDILGEKPDDREQQIAALAGKLQELDHKIATIQRRIRDEGTIDALLPVVEQLTEDKKRTANRLDKLKAEKSHQQPTALGEAQTLIGLLSTAQGDDRKNLRLKIRARIRQLVSEMWLFAYDVSKSERYATLQIFLHSGRMRMLDFIWTRRGKNRGEVEAGDFWADPGDEVPLADLRQYRTDARLRAWFANLHPYKCSGPPPVTLRLEPA